MKHQLRMALHRVQWWLEVDAPHWVRESYAWCERVIFCHHNARVLADFEYRMSCVLTECTHGMSKAYYDKDSMIAEIQDFISGREDEAVDAFIEDELDYIDGADLTLEQINAIRAHRFLPALTDKLFVPEDATRQDLTAADVFKAMDAMPDYPPEPRYVINCTGSCMSRGCNCTAGHGAGLL